jgi:hypothetical protein
MSTGISTLNNLPDIGPAYPFAGMEVAFALMMLAFFVIFLIWQIAMESKHHDTIIGNFTASPETVIYDGAEPLPAFEEPKLSVTAS